MFKEPTNSGRLPLIALLVALGSSGLAGVARGGETIYIPGDVINLQTAIYQISDGGTIIVASGTVLTAPTGGFKRSSRFQRTPSREQRPRSSASTAMAETGTPCTTSVVSIEGLRRGWRPAAMSP